VPQFSPRFFEEQQRGGLNFDYSFFTQYYTPP
jgi:hypothetical protein